ncbi:MAG: AAA family ATPase [Cyclobacteriaceae bacterium]|nr:AAA family ATPase [Cyclobacteriaceae bacterium]
MLDATEKSIRNNKSSFAEMLKNGNAEKPTETHSFTVITAKELIDRPFTKLPMLVEGLIPSVGLSVFAGSSDLGKSSWLRQFAIHLVNGEERFCGFKLNPVHKNVVFVCSEDDASMTQHYLHNLKPNRSGLESIRFIFDSVDLVGCIEKSIKETPADLVVVDCMLDFYGGARSISQANELRAWLGPLKRIANKYNTQVILLHHVGKRADEKEPNKANLLGSVGLEQAARLVLELRAGEEPNQRYLCILKANFLPNTDKVDAHELKFEDFRFKSTGYRRPLIEIVKRSTERSGEQKEEMVLKVMELYKNGVSQSDIARQTMVPKTTVNRWIKTCSTQQTENP